VLFCVVHFLARIPGDRAFFVGVWAAGALLDAFSLEQQLSCWWGLQDEVEGTVFVDGDFYWDDVAAHGFGCSVVRLAEFHDVDAVCTKCRTNWRSWVSSACFDLQLDKACGLLLFLRCHRITSFRDTGLSHHDE